MTPDAAPDQTAEQLSESRPRRQEQEDASTEITEVAPGILRLQLPISLPGLGHVNTYALEDGNGFTLIDPGLPGEDSWKALNSRLESAGIPMRRIHHVIVTHSHPDHFGGAGMLAEESGAQVVASSHFRLGWDAKDDGGEPELEIRDLDENPSEDVLEKLADRMAMPTPWGGDGGRLVGEERKVVLERQKELFAWFAARTPPGTSTTPTGCSSATASGWACTHRATPTITSASSTPRAACSSQATTCCRASPRTSPG